MKLDLNLALVYACTLALFTGLALGFVPAVARRLRKSTKAWYRGLRRRWSHGAPRSALPPYLPDVRTGSLF